MGQYYKIINIDKREVLEPLSFNNGMKLMEWSYQRNELVTALENLLKADGRWAGDRVFVCGDYAMASEDVSESDRDIWDEAYIKAAKELGFYGKKEDGYDVTLYNHSDSFRELMPNELNLKPSDNRYVINHAKKIYVDNKHCPIEETWENGNVIKIAPISLLLAMGNGQGGGDYYRDAGDDNVETMKLVGSWANDAGKIEVSGSIPEGYGEFIPNFTENKVMIPWSEEKELNTDESKSVKLKMYTVNIKETLIKTVEVVAENENEAIDKVTDAYKACDIVLSADDFVNTDIECISEMEK